MMRVGLRKALSLGAVALVTMVGVLLVGSSSAWASACVPGTLESYMSLGSGGCTISTSNGDISFRSFGYNASSSGTALPVTPQGMFVTPEVTAGGAAGFLFSGGWFAESDSTSKSFTRSMIKYSAAGVDGTLIAGADLSLLNHFRDGPGSGVIASETLIPPGASLIAYDTGVGVKDSDSKTFVTPLSSIDFAFKSVLVTGGVGPGFAYLDGVYNHLSPVPEPATLALVASTLPGLFLLRRRSRFFGKS